jgi:hypothetical protein
VISLNGFDFFFDGITTPSCILNILSGDAFDYENIGILSGFYQTLRVVAVSTECDDPAIGFGREAECQRMC